MAIEQTGIPPNNELRKYYEYLKGAKADVPPTLESFEKTLSDEKAAREYYTYLVDNKFDTPPSFESFSNTFGLKKKGLRSEATSLAAGTVSDVGSPSKSISPSTSERPKVDVNAVLDQAIGGLTPAGNIPKPGEKTISDVFQGRPSSLTLPKKTESTSDVQDLVDSFARGSSNLGKMLSETPAFIYDLAAYPQNKIAELTGLPISASSDQFAATVGLPDNEVAAYYDNAIKASQEKINAKYNKPVSEYFSNGEFDKGFKLLSNQIMESAPISISLAMGNAGGLTPAQSILGGGAVFGAGKKSELDETNPNMSETAKMDNAISTGLFEGIFEQFGITKLGGAVKNILAQEGKDIAKDLAEKGFKETYAPIFKKYLGVSFEESLSEAATQFAQNAVDKYSGAKPDLDLRDGLVDAAIIGFGAGTTFSAAPTALEVVKTKQGLAEAARINQEKATLQQDLASPNIADAAKQTISNRLGELNQEEADLAMEEKTKYAALPTELKSEVDALVKKSSEIQQSLDDPNLSEDGKKLLEKELDTNEKQVDEIYSQSDAQKSAADDAVGTSVDSNITPVGIEMAAATNINKNLPVEVPESSSRRQEDDISESADTAESTGQPNEINNPPKKYTTPKEALEANFSDVEEFVHPPGTKFEGKSEFSVKSGPYVLNIKPTKEGFDVYLGEPGLDVGNVSSFGQIESWSTKNDEQLIDAINSASGIIDSFTQNESAVDKNTEPLKGSEANIAPVVDETIQDYNSLEGVERSVGQNPPKKETVDMFSKSQELFEQIQNTQGAAKKRGLAAQRRKFVEDNPGVAYVEKNLPYIYRTLEAKGLLKREGNCP